MKTIMSILIVSFALPMTAFAGGNSMPGNVDCKDKNNEARHSKPRKKSYGLMVDEMLERKKKREQK